MSNILVIALSKLNIKKFRVQLRLTKPSLVLHTSVDVAKEKPGYFCDTRIKQSL